MQNYQMIIIDPQYDFIDVPENFRPTVLDVESGDTSKVTPALPVDGAWEDSLRLAKFINDSGRLLSRITVTLDSHQQYDIAHPMFWVDENRNNPAPFTMISSSDIKSGKWSPVDKSVRDYTIQYTEALESSNTYQLIIWPPHCLIGTVGHNIVQPIADALLKWEKKYISRVFMQAKGVNSMTEHYGAFSAEIQLSDDPTTKLNTALIKSYEEADLVLLSGQALSHCVATTVKQLADNFGDENIKKLVLLRDTTSPVPGFEQQGEAFIQEMEARGMQVTTTDKVQIQRNKITISK